MSGTLKLPGSSLAVVVPVYNGERYLQKTLDSLYSQTLRDFDIVVINDGSTDGTAALLAKQADRRVRVLEQSNQGISRTRQRALLELNHDLLAFIDADDLAEANRLELQKQYMDENGDCVIVGSCLAMIDEHEKQTGLRSYPLTDQAIRESLPIENVFAQPAVMIRRTAALAAGGYRSNDDGAEDYDLWLRLGLQGRFANLPQPLTRYRMHASQFKASRTRQQLTKTLQVRLRAGFSYGYRRSLRYWLTFIAQALLLGLPSAWVYRLFQWRLAALSARSSE